ncbi:MAG: hypothetical protein AB8I08_13920 [Sandaracinaceae bacterium]
MARPSDTHGMHIADTSFDLRPPGLDASPDSPLVEDWPDDASYVCVRLSPRSRMLIGPQDRWALVQDGHGRVAAGWLPDA